MKKYLPSADEVISGAIVVIVALTVWSVVGPWISSAVNKVVPKSN